MTTFEEVGSLEDLEDSSVWYKAYKSSLNSDMNFKLGSIILDKRGKLVGKGYNTHKTHPIFGTHKNGYRSMHAECHALYDALKKGKSTDNCVMYIYRHNARNARPCEWCERMIREYGIKKVVYTNVTINYREIKARQTFIGTK